MPTQAEIDAGALALSDVDLGPAIRGDVAGAVLVAAEAVRAAAVDTMTEVELLAGLDLTYNASCMCTDCQAYRQAYRAQQPTDQRMTQTPLAGWKRTRDQSG